MRDQGNYKVRKTGARGGVREQRVEWVRKLGSEREGAREQWGEEGEGFVSSMALLLPLTTFFALSFKLGHLSCVQNKILLSVTSSSSLKS